jgi:selenocysteine-specific elongation factor
LLQTGEAVQLSPEILLFSTSFTRASELIGAYLRRHGSASVGELRQVIGASRRVAVPLLEKLDREGVTRRDGDKRVLKQG